MILGSTYERLVAVNGKPLSAERRAEEQQKLEAAIFRQRNESEREKAERIASYEKDRKRDQLMMEQLTKAFDFALVGEQKLEGYDVYVLRATPRADYQPPNMETEVLRGMQGKLWIDKKTFQWVKVEAQVIRPVSIEGFLAQVEPGTRFELDEDTGGGRYLAPEALCHEITGKSPLFFHPQVASGRNLFRVSQGYADSISRR